MGGAQGIDGSHIAAVLIKNVTAQANSPTGPANVITTLVFPWMEVLARMG